MRQPLGFVLPNNADEVDRQSGGNDAETDGTFDGRLPEGNDDEEEAGEHEAHRQQDVHLRGQRQNGFNRRMKTVHGINLMGGRLVTGGLPVQAPTRRSSD